MKRSELKRKFESLLNLSIKFNLKGKEFDSILKEYYGEEQYSEHDIDLIIDSLDYGLHYLSFDEFDEIMININKRKYDIGDICGEE